MPRTQEDFGGGGAFPEVHVSQFPLDMGRPGRASSAMVPLTVGGDGSANFDAIVRQGRGREGAAVHSAFADLVEKDAAKTITARPDEAAEAASAAVTRAALEGIVSHKIASARPGSIPANAVSRPEDDKIIRYTPDESAPGFNPAARTRIIKLVEAAVDPMEPPKFKHKKVPSGPPDAPVPVMHSPPRKLSAVDAAAWKIPVCVSNWKTNRGYVVPLDKRVGADGRGLVEPTINDAFAKLSEALSIAERKARVEVETRAAISRKLAQRSKEEKEAELRVLAARARLERGGVLRPGAGLGGEEKLDEEEEVQGYAGVCAGAAAPRPGAHASSLPPPPPAFASHAGGGRGEAGVAAAGVGAGAGPGGVYAPRRDQRPAWMVKEGTGPSAAEYRVGMAPGGETGPPEEVDAAGVAAREVLRRERRGEVEREFRAEAGGRRSKAMRDGDRDVSERIALGMAPVAGGGGGAEALYDARLFNQAASEGAGVGGGFSAVDDGNGAYDKPWRSGGAHGSDAAVGAALYRPRAAAGGVLSDAAAADEIEGLRSSAAKRFKGEGGAEAVDFEGVRRGGGRAGPTRSGPVEFTRSSDAAPGAGGGDDPFGMGELIAGSKRPASALDGVGRGGGRMMG